jgi:hypothetical protein
MREILNGAIALDEASELAVTVYLSGANDQSATVLTPPRGLQ